MSQCKLQEVDVSLQGFLPESSLFHIVTGSISNQNNDIFVTVNKKHNQVVIHLTNNYGKVALSGIHKKNKKWVIEILWNL